MCNIHVFLCTLHVYSTTATFTLFVKVLIVEDEPPCTAIWVHSILHFFMASNVVNLLDQDLEGISNICISEGTGLDKQ